MGKLLTMRPNKLHFPVGRVWKQEDKFNGDTRGRWFFRAFEDSDVSGPYRTYNEAVLNLLRAQNGAR